MYHCDDHAIYWFKSYLSGRLQKVIINDIESHIRDFQSGVTQGFILEPLLFIIIINDLSLVL